MATHPEGPGPAWTTGRCRGRARAAPKALRMVMGKGLEALRAMPIDSPGLDNAIRAVGLAVRETRVELGEPSDRTAISIEDTIKREYERWMVVEDEEDEDEDEDEDEREEPAAQT